MATLRDVAQALETFGQGRRPHADFSGVLKAATAAPVEEARRLLSQLGRMGKEEKQEGGAALLNRAVFTEILSRGIERKDLFPNLVGAQELWADRALTLLEDVRVSGAFPSLQDDAGIVESLVLLGKYLPVGIYHAVLTGVPRSLLLSVEWADRLRVASYVAVEFRGFKPVIDIHLPQLRARRLLEADYVETHRRLAWLLGHNPKIRGLYNSAWYYDPEVGKISPNLGFLSAFASAHGAILVSLGSDSSSVQDATWKSARRRAAYEAGTYVPTRYARLWSRRRILAWAEATGGGTKWL